MMGLLARAAVAMALASPSPAFASAVPVVLKPAMADLTISQEVGPPVYLKADTDLLSNVELVFDLNGIAGIATARFSPFCATAATVATCRFSGAMMQDGFFWWTNLFSVAPADGAKPGSHGTIKMTASADNAIAGSHNVDVTIEEPGFWLGFDYPTGSRTVHTTVRAGSLVEPPLRMFVGRRPINGAAMVFDLSPRLLGRADDFSNCRYLAAGPLVCTFDMVLQPNTVYELATPIGLRGDPSFHEVFGRTAGVRITLVTGTQYGHLKELRKLMGQAEGQPGHGGRLTLRPAGSAGISGTSTTGSAKSSKKAAAAGSQADSSTGNNWLGLYDMGDTWMGFSVTVFARDASDFSAVLLKPTPDGSGKLNVRMGIRNNGPSTVNVPGGQANGAIVRAPGIHFYNTPPGCVFHPEEHVPGPEPYPSFPEYYWCGTGPLLRAGDTAWFDFTINGVVNPDGGIIINQLQLGFPAIDPNPDDDSATFRSPTPGGGGLPVTGNPTILISIAALLFLLTGTLLRYFTRRKPAENPTATGTAPCPPG